MLVHHIGCSHLFSTSRTPNLGYHCWYTKWSYEFSIILKGLYYGGNRLPRRNLGQPVYKPSKREKKIPPWPPPPSSRIRPHLLGSRRSDLRHLPIHQLLRSIKGIFFYFSLRTLVIYSYIAIIHHQFFSLFPFSSISCFCHVYIIGWSTITKSPIHRKNSSLHFSFLSSYLVPPSSPQEDLYLKTGPLKSYILLHCPSNFLLCSLWQSSTLTIMHFPSILPPE